METFKASKKMTKSILSVVKRWTDNIEECDGRNLSGVSITLNYRNEIEKEYHKSFWDYCEITIQDVAWDGTKNRFERDIYIVNHEGQTFFMS